MKIKKIGAILAGAVMLGSAVAAAWDPAEDRLFFVDPVTGQPNAIIVVGANAAASDVTAGAWVAAQIGNMCYSVSYTEDVETFEWDKNLEDNFVWLTAGRKCGAWTGNDYGYKPQKAILENLYWDNYQGDQLYPKINWQDTFEWITLVPGELNAIEMTTGFIRYGVWFHVGTPFEFLGYTFDPIAVIDDTAVICGESERWLDNESIMVGEYNYGGYIVTFEDINVLGNKVLISVRDLKGKLHSRVLKSGQPLILPGALEEPDYEYEAFKLKVNGIFMGVSSARAYVTVETISDVYAIETPIYCLNSAWGYYNIEPLKVHDPTYSNTYELKMYGIQPTGYYPYPFMPTMMFDVPNFNIAEVESFDYVNGEHFKVVFDAHIDKAELPDIVWELDGVKVVRRTGELIPDIHRVKIYPQDWVLNDDEIEIGHKVNYNLILVGGPGLVVQPNGENLVCNTLTKELVDLGLSNVYWNLSTGEYEYIADAFTDGKAVIIVAGADRAATRNAVIDLLDDLNQ